MMADGPYDAVPSLLLLPSDLCVVDCSSFSADGGDDWAFMGDSLLSLFIRKARTEDQHHVYVDVNLIYICGL